MQRVALPVSVSVTGTLEGANFPWGKENSMENWGARCVGKVVLVGENREKKPKNESKMVHITAFIYIDSINFPQTNSLNSDKNVLGFLLGVNQPTLTFLGGVKKKLTQKNIYSAFSFFFF